MQVVQIKIVVSIGILCKAFVQTLDETIQPERRRRLQIPQRHFIRQIKVVLNDRRAEQKIGRMFDCNKKISIRFLIQVVVEPFKSAIRLTVQFLSVAEARKLFSMDFCLRRSVSTS